MKKCEFLFIKEILKNSFLLNESEDWKNILKDNHQLEDTAEWSFVLMKTVN